MATLSRIRGWIMAVLVFGLLGTITELLLLEHYEDGWQFVPLLLIVCALAVVSWHGVRPNATNVRALQAVMTLFLIAGFVGVGLHFRGGAEFQSEIDPSQHAWSVFKKVIRAKAPPVLAPGVMVQLGLIGLVYGYRHPAVTDQDRVSQRTE